MPITRASYSASLLEALKLNLMANSRSSPCGVVMTMPAPLPCALWRSHLRVTTTSDLEMLLYGHLAISEMKSAKACALMVVLGKYEMSYSLNSTPIFTSRPEVSGLPNVCFSGVFGLDSNRMRQEVWTPFWQ
ncbi:UNVERIFIED_CONTAM: hypothetical protein Slati_0025500 [Sesamum latifolium]|uniref:Uncharacterized protein n=1 Tax=Sesamum latifolium TaxID=2727402 RepID=A0AAW2Y6H8_9LAMI